MGFLFATMYFLPVLSYLYSNSNGSMSAGAFVNTGEPPCILAALRNEEFAVCLVRVDDPCHRLEGVLVGTLHAVLGVGKELKTRGRDVGLAV